MFSEHENFRTELFETKPRNVYPRELVWDDLLANIIINSICMKLINDKPVQSTYSEPLNSDSKENTFYINHSYFLTNFAKAIQRSANPDKYIINCVSLKALLSTKHLLACRICFDLWVKFSIISICLHISVYLFTCKCLFVSCKCLLCTCK